MVHKSPPKALILLFEFRMFKMFNTKCRLFQLLLLRVTFVYECAISIVSSAAAHLRERRLAPLLCSLNSSSSIWVKCLSTKSSLLSSFFQQKLWRAVSTVALALSDKFSDSNIGINPLYLSFSNFS